MKAKVQFLKKLQLNKACLIIAFIHWILSFFTDTLIFQYVTWDFSNLTQTVKTAMTYGAKAVFLLVLIGLWHGIFAFVKKGTSRFKIYTLGYFSINMVLLILTWPGIWRMDEFGILNSALHLFPVFWQNYLTSLFYVFSLMLIPIPSGVIVIQCLCISLIVGKILCFFEKQFGRWGLVTAIPFLFFPVLDSNLYPMRMSLYGFLELLLIVVLYEQWQKACISQVEKRENENISSLLGIIVIAAFVTVWRTEAIYYFVLFPVLLGILFRKKWSKNKWKKAISLYLVFSFVLFVPQNLGDKYTSGNQYDLTSVVLPLVPLIEEADRLGTCSEELSAIDKVVDVEIAAQGAREGKSGISLFWSNPDFQKKAYSDEDYAEFKKAYYDLILKYPSVFLKERWTCFLQSEDLLENTTELFLKSAVANYDTFRSYPMTEPVSNSLRNGVICTLEFRSTEDYNQKKSAYSMVYGVMIPILVIITAWVCCFIKRKWSRFFLLSLPLCKLPLIFLTAPSRLFMYYYSLYLIGYVLLFYMILQIFVKVWKKIQGPVGKTIRYGKRNGIKAAYYAVMERVDHVHVDAYTKKAMAYKGCRTRSVATQDEKNASPKETLSEIKNLPKVSIVVPTYETKEEFLEELLDCVLNQTYPNWELVLADASKTDRVAKVVEASNCAVTYIPLEENKGISENTNVAIEAATGDYIALLDHDDLLTYDALEKMVLRLYESDVKNPRDVIGVYSDEDKCDGEGKHFYEPYFKPDFNLDLLLSNNYICHFLMIKADILKACKLRPQYDGAQDYDLVLRLAQMKASSEKIILHEPSVLYHWRCHEASTAINTDSKRYAYDAGREALKDFYRQRGLADFVEVTDSQHLGFYTTTYKPDIFAVRQDVAAVCGRVVKNGVVIGSPDDLFNGLKVYGSGYMHRADLYMEVKTYDERALQVRNDLLEKYGYTLDEALKQGMKLIYDPHFVEKI